jgi:hypothetical protein
LSQKTPLNPTQQRAARLLAAQVKIPKIAAMLGVSERIVYVWKKKPDFISFLNKLVEEHTAVVQGALLEGELAAVGTVTEALEANDPKGKPMWEIRLKAAFRLLDSAGGRGAPTLKTESKHMEITGDVTELFKNALRDPGVRKRLMATGMMPDEEEIPDGDFEVVEPRELSSGDAATSGGSEDGPDEVQGVREQTEPVLPGDSGGEAVETPEGYPRVSLRPST